MRYIFMIFILLSFFFGCVKKEKQPTANTTEESIVSSMETPSKLPDMEKLRETVKNANKLNSEVVIAITILHRNYISDLESEMFDKNVPEWEKEKLFEEKKNNFFHTIKFSYAEYTKYIEEHADEINEYITIHPELLDYMSTENRGM